LKLCKVLEYDDGIEPTEAPNALRPGSYISNIDSGKAEPKLCKGENVGTGIIRKWEYHREGKESGTL
jgi:hypothetical protein